MTPLDLLALLRATFAEFRRDKCTQLAAGVAYYVLLSLFPLVIFGVSVLGVVLRDDERRQDFIDSVIEALPLNTIEEAQDGVPPQSGVQTELERNLRDAMDSVRGFGLLGAVSLLATLWAATGMFGAIRNALDRAWNVAEPKRNFLAGKLVDLMMAGGIGLLLSVSIALTTSISIARSAANYGPFPSDLSVVWQTAGIATSLAVTFAALMALYRLVPDSDEPRWSTVWPGAALGAAGWEALKYGFSLYVENFGSYNQVYGTLGTVVVFLFWSWLVASITLFGAELSAEYGRRRRADRSDRGRLRRASGLA